MPVVLGGILLALSLAGCADLSYKSGNAPNCPADMVAFNETSQVTASQYAAVSHKSLEEVDRLPVHGVVKKLGSGMSGQVKLVRLDNGFEAALKCSNYPGYSLLRGFGHMLEVQRSKYFPRAYGYYKLKNGGDCVFMEATGPDLAQLRNATGSAIWPQQTIASIGLQLLRAFKKMHEEFRVAHRDANPRNIAISRTAPSGALLPIKAMLIDFDFSQSLYANQYKVYDIRQLLVSLRYLHDGDDNFWLVNTTTGACGRAHNRQDCAPGPVPLCEAMQYACSLGDRDKVDYNYFQSQLERMLNATDCPDLDQIIWTDDIANEIVKNLAIK
jgi:hypothetical protein